MLPEKNYKEEIKMWEIFYFTKRNWLIYIRDKSAVFYSFLSTIIVLVLMVVFLGKMNTSDLVKQLSAFGERDIAADEKNATYFIQLWTLAGLLIVNAVNITLTVIGAMVHDEARHRSVAFYVSPIRRIKLSLGYILSAWLAGTFMCVVTLAAGEIYFRTQGYPFLTFADLCSLFCMILLNTFTFSALGYLLALSVNSESAWSGIMTIIGTLVGFAGGIYLPIGTLSGHLQKILKCMPIIHGAAMMRYTCISAATKETFAGAPDAAVDIFNEHMGVTLFWDGNKITLGMQVMILLAYAIIAIIAATFLSRKRKAKER